MEVGRYRIGGWVQEGRCDISIYTNSNDDEQIWRGSGRMVEVLHYRSVNPPSPQSSMEMEWFYSRYINLSVVLEKNK